MRGSFVAAACDPTASFFICALLTQGNPQQRYMIVSELLGYGLTILAALYVHAGA